MHFFNSESGERFYIRGVDYQPGGSSNLTDPLADASVCDRDVPVLKDLGINTVRVYTVDNSQDHSHCMKLLQENACSYNADYLQNVFATIDTFADYDNVLGFFAGNEVINSVNTTNTATYVKAVVRDMKKYIKARKYRQIPVGYSAADIVANRQ
ncbi:AHL_G0049180.mRNA.1.CDS.1 [Saccharomyces cerevisiae]|nr:AHL_G0049180.mRNA.1.CDS.1 [Saccharomyces cerevisiae]CAI6878632.1 AHL_G0049180.mRNA.1.CDS.1 [Saccharomyces cerevisiae]